MWRRYLDWLEREAQRPAKERLWRAAILGGLCLALAAIIVLGASYLLRNA